MKKCIIALMALFISACSTQEVLQFLNTTEPLSLDTPADIALLTPDNGSEEVRGLTPVSLIWTEPVLPLQNHQDASRVLNGLLSFEPSHPGEWRTLGASGISFQPKEPWPASTEFKLVVNPMLVSDIDYQFTTPRLTWLYLESDNLVAQEPLAIAFNQPVDLARLSAALKVLPGAVTSSVGFDLAYGESEVEGKMETDQSRVLLTPREPWTESGDYTLELVDGAYAVEGPLPLGQTLTEKFSAAPAFGIEALTLPEFNNRSLSIRFTAPVSSADFARSLSLSPPLGDEAWEAYRSHWIESDYESRYFTLFPPEGSWDPRETFTLTISGELNDTFGRALGESRTETFSTTLSDQFRPIYWPQSDSTFAPDVPIQPRFMYGGNVTQATVMLNDSVKVYPLNSSDKTLQVLTLDVASEFPSVLDDAGQIKPGEYNLKVTATVPGMRYPLEYETRWFVSDFTVEIKDMADDRYQLWAQPFPGKSALPETFTVEVWSGDWQTEKRQQVIEGASDGQLFEVPQSQLKKVVVQAGDLVGYGSPRFTNGMNPWDAQIEFGQWRYNERYSGVLFTDRPLYKPGQKLYFKGFVRELALFGEQFPLLQNAANLALNYTLTVWDPEYDELLTQSGQITGGSFDGELMLPEEARLGQYRVNISVENPDGGSDLSLESPFWIQEYRKPNFLIQSSFDKDYAIEKDVIEAQVKAQYAFGGAIADRGVEYQVTLFGYEPCKFWCWGWRQQSDKVITSGTSTTDSDGLWTLKVPLKDLELENIDWELLTLNATIKVSEAEQSSTEVSVPFYRSDRRISLRGLPSFLDPTETRTLNGVVENIEAEAQDNATVTLTLAQTKWVRNERLNPDGDFYGEWESVETDLESWSAKTNERGEFAFDFKAPDDGGEYLWKFSTTDEAGRAFEVRHYFWVAGNDLTRVRQNDTNKILWLFPEQTAYVPGDTVKIFAPNSDFQVTRAHVTLERGEVLRTLPFNSETLTTEFEAEAWMAPNVFVSVLLEGEDAKGNPMVRWGASAIKIEDSSHMLEVKVTPDKGIYRPGDTVNLNIETTVNGNGQAGEVAVSVVDQTLLALKARPEINLIERLIGNWPLGVSTYHTLANFMSKAEMEAVLEQADALQARMEMGFGGGGGKGDDFKPRGDFRDTAAFLAKVKTDENGQAQTAFVLPDNLTTWNIFAAAATDKNAFGTTETDFQVTLPLLVSELVPNFFMSGDAVRLGLLVYRDGTNKDSEKVNVTLTVPDGFEVIGAAEQSVEVETEERVYFTVKVPETLTPQTASFGFDIQAPESGLRDAVVLERQWLPPVQRTSVAELIRVTDQTSLAVSSADNAITSHLSVKVFASIANYLENLVEVAARMDYGCAEQRLSRFTAQLYQIQFDRTLGRAGETLKIADLEKQRDEIEAAFVNGQGFGYWRGSDQASLWVSAQVLEHADLWHQAGAPFAEDKLRTTAQWLRTQMLQECLNNTWSCPSGDVRAHAAWVLADRGELSVHDLVSVEAFLDSLESKLWWLKAAAKVGDLSPASQTVVENHLKALEAAVTLEDRYAFWSVNPDYRSFFSQDERLTALALEVLMAYDRLDTLQPRVARYLSESHHEFLSGNTSMRILKALSAYSLATETDSVGASFTVSNNDDGEVLLKGSLQDLAQVQAFEDKGLIPTQTLNFQTDKPLYAEVELSDVLPAAEAAEQARGFWIEREIYALEGAEPQTDENLETLEIGQNYLVRLRVVTASAHRQVMIESPIPSGAEIVNFDFDNADQTLAQAVEGDRVCVWGWCVPDYQHKEFKYDRARFFVDYLPAGTHEMNFIIQTRLAGDYEWLPAKVEEMYFPEVFATSQGKRVEIEKD